MATSNNYLPPLQTHEDFSLTGMLLSTTNKWHQESDLGSFGARTVNLLCTLFTAVIDAVAHLALGALSVGGLSELGWLYNAGAWLFCSKKSSPITFTGGISNFCNGLKHTVAIVAAPVLGLVNPTRAAEQFVHKGSQKAAEKRAEVQRANKECSKVNRAKGHVINNVKAAHHDLERLDKALISKDEVIENQVKENKMLKGKANALAKSGKLAIEGNLKATDALLAKIAALEAQNNHLILQNTQLTQQNATLQTMYDQSQANILYRGWNFIRGTNEEAALEQGVNGESPEVVM